MSPYKLVAVALALSTIASCRESPWIERPNKVPTSKALVVDADGASVSAATFPFDGSPVEVTLDGSQSTDGDGTIVKYRWFSSTTAVPAAGTAGMAAGGAGTAGMGTAGMGAAGSDAGGTGAAGTGAAGAGAGAGAAGMKAGRLVPDGQPADWPEDIARPKVMLPQGVWQFSLWVVDNKGKTSDPTTVLVRVGVDPVKQCVDAADQTVAEGCRTCTCGVSDACRAAVVACDATCWKLINCVNSNCPDFPAMAAKMDYSCVTAMCADSLGGATLSAPVTPCLMMCPDTCNPMSM